MDATLGLLCISLLASLPFAFLAYHLFRPH